MSIATKRPISFRLDADDLQAIDKLAKQHRLNRTEYVVRASLGQLGSVGLDERVEELEQRLETIEHRLSLGYE